MKKLFKYRKGQNTVEYLLMLAVTTGVVLITGMALRNYIPKLFSQLQTLISGAATTLGSPTGAAPQ
jgi:Flp pilus assembly pilin Flp